MSPPNDGTSSGKPAGGASLGSNAEWIDQIPDAIIMVDMSGRVIAWNKGAERIYGYRAAEAIGRHIGFLYFDEDRAVFADRLLPPRLLEHGYYEGDHRNRCKDGRAIDVALRISLIRDPAGEPVGLVGCANDITERRQSERRLQGLFTSLEKRVLRRTWELEAVAERLRESEATYRDLFDNANDLIQCVAPDGSFVYVNTAWRETLGYTDEEVKQLNLFDIICPESLQHCRAAFEQVLAGQQLRRVEVRFRTKDGRTVVAEGNTNCKFDQGKPVTTRGIFRDVTDRKEAEEAVRSQQKLLQQLFDLQERERKLIAHDIHDGLLQYLVGARMHIESSLPRLEKASAQDAQELRAALQLLDQAMEEGRRMIGELRPLVIDEEGIVEAIRYLANDKRFCAGLDVDFQADVTFDRLDPMLEGTVFRIVQEALTNVKHHGQTTSATVRLREENGTLLLEIADEGVGFDLEKVPAGRFGVRGIQERARLFGGEATIETSPGKGTRVRVRIPIRGAGGETP